MELPKELVKRIENRIKGTDFSTVQDYVTYVLTEVLDKLDKKSSTFSASDEQKVKDRLSKLGYLD
ncbi:MAG TPA: CopG family transcriptional regulator [Candidatus Nanoarchaeia archaeon]|nr:CopG family transcriptional regulator [Candidatus Nanoarchaeia archaeon]